MQKYIVIRVVGAIIFAISSAIGYALDISEIANIGNKWWPFITSLIFLALIFWVITDLYQANRRLLDARPSIIVETIKERDTYLLKITNNGEQAIFKAQISLSEEDPSVFTLSDKSHYQACWDNVEKNQANISKGHSELIKLAELYSSPPLFNIQTWHLFYCDHDARENYVATSSYIIGAMNVHEDGSRTPLEPAFEYKLHVVISSNPSLREGTYHRDYIISYQRGLEQLYFDNIKT